MENRQLVLTEQYGKQDRTFVIKIFKGAVMFKGQAQFQGHTYTKLVSTKSFSMVVHESSTDELGNPKYVTEYFMDFTARAGEFKYVLSVIEKDCKSMDDIRFLIDDTKERFSVAMKKDAAAVVRRQLGLLDRQPNFGTTTYPYQGESPLPQRGSLK
jgi:hypothetical protein